MLHLPWLELSVLIPLAGAAWVWRIRTAEKARRHTIVIAAATLLCALGAWQDFEWMNVGTASGPWIAWAMIDRLSAPVLPLAAMLYLATCTGTLRTKVNRYSFAAALLSLAILLATLCCREPWGIIALLAAGTLPPYLELRARRKPVRVYVLHMSLFVALLVTGQALLDAASGGALSALAVALLAGAVLIRSGVVPLHAWMTDLFEHATFGTALLFVTPMVGAYAAVRLVLPSAPDWILGGIALTSLLTAVYAAGMALVQQEARRFFCYLFLSHSSLVLVGLETATTISMTGALSLWLSAGLALAGFGLTLRSIESRTGRLSLADYHGLYDHIPMLAVFFLLTGLASVGFPGTFGFVGIELLVDGAVSIHPAVGMAVVVATALNGIAVLQTYFRVFTGKRHATTIRLRSRFAERVAVLVLTAIILGGGLFPQPGISSRHGAAVQLVEGRRSLALTAQHPNVPEHIEVPADARTASERWREGPPHLDRQAARAIISEPRRQLR